MMVSAPGMTLGVALGGHFTQLFNVGPKFSNDSSILKVSYAYMYELSHSLTQPRRAVRGCYRCRTNHLCPKKKNLAFVGFGPNIGLFFRVGPAQLG